MELIDDWDSEKWPQSAPSGALRSGRSVKTSLADAIGAKLADMTPEPIGVHCYEDVGYPWVRVVFGDTITPDVALRVGALLADVTGGQNVFFNSLRPQAVCFVLAPAFEPAPSLPVTRYGTALADIRWKWLPGATGKAKTVRRRKSAAAAD